MMVSVGLPKGECFSILGQKDSFDTFMLISNPLSVERQQERIHQRRNHLLSRAGAERLIRQQKIGEQRGLCVPVQGKNLRITGL
jgi:hypothetical protein